MTLEHRQFIELQEIVALRYRCKGCRMELRLMRIDGPEYMPIMCRCPRNQCGKNWVRDQSVEYQALIAFLSSINRLIEAEGTMEAMLQLEIQQSPNKEGE